MRQLLENRLVRAGLVVAVAAVAAVGWWLGSPLFLDTEVDEAFPLAARASIPDDMTAEEVEDEMREAAEAQSVEVDESMPVEAEPEGPVAVATGTVRGADDFHEGSGTATVYRLDDGSHVLRLEDFEVTNGPDLHVLIVPDAEPTDRSALDGYLDLGSLKGNIGNQNYELPAGLDPADFGSVVIYCEPFHVIFATATITPAG